MGEGLVRPGMMEGCGHIYITVNDHQEWTLEAVKTQNKIRKWWCHDTELIIC